jgi:hypothetical protein
MASTQPSGEPYRLAGRRLPFVNWFYVRPGRFGWFDQSGQEVTVSGDLDAHAAHYRAVDRPLGIRLVAQPAQRRGPVLQPELPYEARVTLHTILQVGATYQAWGRCKTVDGQTFAAYFESDDGLHWRRPAVGLIEYNGSRANPFVQPMGGSVFLDPSGPPEERYKSVAEAYFTPEQFAAYLRRRPGDYDPKAIRSDIQPGSYWWQGGNICGARGWVSPDGLRWTEIDEPLVVTHTDTQIICEYDAQRRKYVGYFRDWQVGDQAFPTDTPAPSAWINVGRRAIGRAETDDFRTFPLPQRLLDPRLDRRPSQVLYTNCKTTFPGAPDQHLLFPAVWEMADDTTTIDLASSADGLVWNWVPGAPVFAHPNLIELLGGDFALPYTGYDVPHKYPRGQFQYSTGYAIWPHGRLVALEAPERGEFATVGILPPGQRLTLNAFTARAGFVLVEAVGLDGQPLPGRSFAEAVPIVGDQPRAPIRWREHEELGLAPGEAVILRFRLERAQLFWVEFG